MNLVKNLNQLGTLQSYINVNLWKFG